MFFSFFALELTKIPELPVSVNPWGLVIAEEFLATPGTCVV